MIGLLNGIHGFCGLVITLSTLKLLMSMRIFLRSLSFLINSFSTYFTN